MGIDDDDDDEFFELTPKSKYVVTSDNPFYNSVKYCDTIEQAQSLKGEVFKHKSDPGGSYICHITISRIVETVPFESYF